LLFYISPAEVHKITALTAGLKYDEGGRSTEEEEEEEECFFNSYLQGLRFVSKFSLRTQPC